MGDILQVFVFIICGIVLLWLGYYLFFGPLSPIYPHLPWSKKRRPDIVPKISQYCPVCSYQLKKGEQLKTVVFPSRSMYKDRIMHIHGCPYCLENRVPRKCPVCKRNISNSDFLLARMFERSMQKNHVHVLGCNKCRKV